MRMHEVKELEDGIKVMKLKDCYMYYVVDYISKNTSDIFDEKECIRVLYITEMKEI